MQTKLKKKLTKKKDVVKVVKGVLKAGTPIGRSLPIKNAQDKDAKRIARMALRVVVGSGAYKGILKALNTVSGVTGKKIVPKSPKK